MMRILTEHIELNQYLFKLKMKCPINNKIPTSPNCSHCDKIESVTHYLTKCKRFRFQRQSLFRNLRRIDHRYRYTKFQSVKYLLFPYFLFRSNILKQSLVWKEILNYIKETKRFENIYRIDLNQI